MAKRPLIAATPRMTPRKMRFVEEYVIDLDATHAAMRAGYSSTNNAAAGVTGRRLLHEPLVAAAIAKLKKKQSDRVEITADRVIQELWRLAMSDIGEAVDENGNVKPLKTMPEAIRRAISGVDVDELFEGRGDERVRVGLTKKLRLWDKGAALALLMKHMGLANERHEVKTVKAFTREERAARVQQLLEKGGAK